MKYKISFNSSKGSDARANEGSKRLTEIQEVFEKEFGSDITYQVLKTGIKAIYKDEQAFNIINLNFTRIPSVVKILKPRKRSSILCPDALLQVLSKYPHLFDVNFMLDPYTLCRSVDQDFIDKYATIVGMFEEVTTTKAQISNNEIVRQLKEATPLQREGVYRENLYYPSYFIKLAGMIIRLELRLDPSRPAPSLWISHVDTSDAFDIPTLIELLKVLDKHNIFDEVSLSDTLSDTLGVIINKPSDWMDLEE